MLRKSEKKDKNIEIKRGRGNSRFVGSRFSQIIHESANC